MTTRLVQVSVIVQDKRGKPVTGLKKEDFALLEQDKEQAISTFSVESTRVFPSDASPLAPNTFSNRIESRFGMPTSITVILFDGLNTKIQDQAYAREQIGRFLQQLQPQDRVAIYALGRSAIRVLHDFTSDSAALLAVLKKHPSSAPLEAGPSISLSRTMDDPSEILNSQLDQFLEEAHQRVSDFYIIDRARITTAAMEALANRLARFPGRKNLVWVSSGFPLSINLDSSSPTADRRTFTTETERAARALSNANVAVYPVDARGLVVDFAEPINVFPSGRVRPGSPLILGRDYYAIQTLKVLAERTGGTAFYNRNDLDNAIRSAIDDSRVSYVLGYYPSHAKWDGRFVELKVKVKRPGLRVRARPGYFADTEGKADADRITTMLEEAAGSPLDATGLGLQVRVMSGESNVDRRLTLTADVDTHDITLHRDGERWVGALDFYFGQYNAEGKSITSVRETLDMRLKTETYRLFTAKKTVSLNVVTELKPETVQVRVVVRDSLSGAVGSLSIPVTKLQPVEPSSPRSSLLRSPLPARAPLPSSAPR